MFDRSICVNKIFLRLSQLKVTNNLKFLDMYAVFEIKGALCTRRAQFGCRVHMYRNVCTRRVDLISEHFFTLCRPEHKGHSPGTRS